MLTCCVRDELFAEVALPGGAVHRISLDAVRAKELEPQALEAAVEFWTGEPEPAEQAPPVAALLQQVEQDLAPEDRGTPAIRARQAKVRTLGVRLVDHDTGEPLSGIYLDAAGPHGAAKQTTTDVRGRGSFQGLRPGTVTLRPWSLRNLQTKKKASKKSKYTVGVTGSRKVYEPVRPNGKTLYFFFGYTTQEKDQEMLEEEAPDLEDDIRNAASGGFRVVYDRAGSRESFLEALYDADCAGIYWSGHGSMDGRIQSSAGDLIGPSDVDRTRVNPDLGYIILAACGSGLGAARWRAVLPAGAQFEGWTETTTVAETRDFTSRVPLLDDLWSHHGMNPGKELDDYIDDAK